MGSSPIRTAVKLPVDAIENLVARLPLPTILLAILLLALGLGAIFSALGLLTKNMRLMDMRALRRYARIRRNDLVAAMGALLGVVLFGTLNGLLIAIGLSLLGLVYRASRVQVEEIGRIKSEKAAWGSISRHPQRRGIDGLKILRLDAPLFWVNAAAVEEQVIAAVDAAPGIRAVILDLEVTDQLDTTSTDMLHNLIGRLRQRGIDLYLVRVMFRARVVLKRAGIRDVLGDQHMWRTISQAVKRATKDHGLSAHAKE